MGDVSQFEAEEKDLLAAIAGTIEFYRVSSAQTIRFQRTVAIAAMVLGVLAPLFVAGGGPG